MRTRFKGLKKQQWYSLCSKHFDYQESCKMCNQGLWNNIILTKFENIIYFISPKLWIWWINK